ncbi:MAG: hypothetical protein A3H93_00475 [Rhodocyclales bacterium RIFCSPLOWO2_02_FULL_63_24]|nr:MAG: hypothetical protein A2040_06775 [Rhodocyclales bacterium GWA2_65_19]OHC72222.1 MAG: hypothetical protein A3H93_00475 [Rhodocyclales bacterium RIFCSPLOWO2_02_FULL_63_24]
MIAAGVVERVAAAVVAASPTLLDIDLQHRLRAEFDGLRVVVCSDDDVPPRLSPAFGNARCNLYYLDAGEHCVKLTGDAEAASGLVVALLGEALGADGD